MSVKVYSKKKDGETYLTKNFQVKEFACKDNSDKILIDTDLVDILQKVRDHFNQPVTLNSAYRSPSHNRAVGGVSNSQHVYGTAADTVVKNVSPVEVSKYVEFLMSDRGGIGLYTTFTHIDVRSWRSRWQNYGREVAVSGFPGYSEPKKETVITPKEPSTPKYLIEKEKWNYRIEGTTHIIEADPSIVGTWMVDKPGAQVDIANFVNGGYFMQQANGKTAPQGHLVIDGKIISNYATHGKPVTTLCIFYDGVVQIKKIQDISLERGLRMAISGASLTDYKDEGFTGQYSDIARKANRTYIGYREKDNKIIICYRPNTTVARALQTFKNLEVDKGLTLDGGGSCCLRVDGKWKVKTNRQIHNVLMWG